MLKKIKNKFNTKAGFTYRLLEELFLRSWWVLIFVLGCGIVYEWHATTLDGDYSQLKSQYLAMQEDKLKMLHQQTELHGKVHSQSDPAWIELTLLRVLGLVPDGQTKILFKEED